MPLSAGHVLVRLGDGAQEVADAVLDVLEGVFETHTGRGRTRIGDVWDVPPTLTSEGTWTVAESQPGGASAIPAPGPSVSSSQAFNVRSSTPPPEKRIVLPGEITAELLGAPEDVRTMVRTISGLCSAREEGQEEQGPQLAVRLRLGHAVAEPG
ncbi:hypothetical protein ACH4E7_38120 [Kitasatospora sp. NPDC018058]|uniref:hypothetical protein n=1 Tax=Kitasatospora sp. NPDC018058 TaxID=3364025 RepID=UPI0037C0BB13